jgi:type VI secretion system secreted protein Hcp
MPVIIDQLTSAATGDVSDIYLSVQTKRAGKVAGEAVAAGHEDEIQLRGWSWGMAASSAIGSTQATGRRSYKALTVVKAIDAATTPLMSALATNDEVKEARLSMRRAGGQQDDYFVVTLNGARVTAIEHLVGAEGSTTESVAFSFTKVRVEYFPQESSGQRGGAKSFEDEYLLGAGA